MYRKSLRRLLWLMLQLKHRRPLTAGFLTVGPSVELVVFGEAKK